MKDITLFSPTTDITSAKSTAIKFFQDLVKEEILENCVLETEHLKELQDIEDFLSALSSFIQFATRQIDLEYEFTSIIRYVNWKKSHSAYFDDSPPPSEVDYQRLVGFCNNVYSDSGLVQAISDASGIKELNNLATLLMHIQALVRTARNENCWSETESRLNDLMKGRSNNLI